MSDDRADRERARKLADELIDYAVYAPLGAALALADEVPELVRRGRERFGARVRLAQVVGKVAVDAARRQAEGFVRGPSRQATERTEPSAASQNADVPFLGYDALGAAEVIARLASLSDAKLRAVRAYEEAHRARRTVLGRITQLLDRHSS